MLVNDFATEGAIYVDITMSGLDVQYERLEGVTRIAILGWNGRDSVKLRAIINVFANNAVALITRSA